jgi:hypothetical protein
VEDEEEDMITGPLLERREGAMVMVIVGFEVAAETRWSEGV